ncbi:MAG: 6-bladed beta-propeller [Bacteroidaceae bacterium]|nr:6-bladed beta-propeller [Bacteroidaceae bacterium]
MKKIFLFIMTLILVSCSYTEHFIPGKTINLDTESKSVNEIIKSVSVLPFEVDDTWKYITSPLMTKADDTFIFLTHETCFLMGYKENGNKVFSRHIKGRGRGEVLEVNNIYVSGDTVCLYDVAKCEVEMYDKQGNFCSKIDGPFPAEYLYPLKDHFVGMTAVTSKGKKYVTVFDREKKVLDSYLAIPEYLKGQSMKFGQTPMSYCFKDSVRFMMPYDYNIYSVSENGIESKYCFVPEKPIPSAILKQMESDMPVLDKLKLVGPYDDDFQGLFETERYLYFYYSRNHVLYDKQTNTVFKTQNPDRNYIKDMAADMTCDDLWKYVIGSFLPLYSEGNHLYGRLPWNIYNILNDLRNQLDPKLTSLLIEMEEYCSVYTLLSDDVVIVQIDFYD